MTNNEAAAATSHHAVIIGEGTLAKAVQDVLADRKISATVVASPEATSAAMSELSNAGTPTTLVFNVWFPNPKSDSPETLGSYPQKLLTQSLEASEALSQHPVSAIINFAFLPAIYLETELEDQVASLRGGITGVTRTLARKFGRKGIRVTCVQAGLVDMPETQCWVSDAVKNVQVPSKRWATPTEVAKFMVFLAADSLYTTGQTMIIDGGLTAGITGT